MSFVRNGMLLFVMLLTPELNYLYRPPRKKCDTEGCTNVAVQGKKDFA